MRKNNILLTGAAGFIGSNLVRYLIKKNYYVIGMDNLLTGDIDNLNDLFDSNNFEFIEHDINDPIEINEKIDYVLHFASPASPVDYMKYPVETLKANAFGGFNALEIAKNKKAKFLLASTSEVYGDPLIHPQTESYYGNVNPIGPRSIYDESKRFIESMAVTYNRVYKLKTSIARIFNTYGPGMKIDDGRVLPNFIFQASNNKNITINGDGNQTRSFCYIDDLVDGIFRLMKSDYKYPINIGNDDEIKIIDVAKIIIKLINSDSKIQFEDLPLDDPLKRKPNIDLAKKILNWHPKISREKGFSLLIQYYKNKKLI